MSLHFELLESLSLTGNPAKPNEDSFAVGLHAAAVFDGATGLGERLMPGPSDAQWLAQFAARRFAAYAEGGQGNVRDWLRAAARDAEKSFHALRKRPPSQNYEIPYASAAMVALEDGNLRVLWFGDCAVLLRSNAGKFNLLGDAMEKRESERARVQRLWKAQTGGPAAAGVREEFLPALRAARNTMNDAKDWAFAPDPACADHAKEARVKIAPDSLVLLASDGFLALASDYGRYTPEELLASAAQHGLASLGRELRAVEASDPDGLRYPRFKRSDDATALLLLVRG
jgi:serine/threonine protein phosphatase PrpC